MLPCHCGGSATMRARRLERLRAPCGTANESPLAASPLPVFRITCARQNRVASQKTTARWMTLWARGCCLAIVRHQLPQRRRRHNFLRPRRSRAWRRHEMPNERRNVFTPRPQRRQVERQYVQPKVEIGPKPVAADQRLEVVVRSRHHVDVGVLESFAAKRQPCAPGETAASTARSAAARPSSETACRRWPSPISPF